MIAHSQRYFHSENSKATIKKIIVKQGQKLMGNRLDTFLIFLKYFLEIAYWQIQFNCFQFNTLKINSMQNAERSLNNQTTSVYQEQPINKYVRLLTKDWKQTELLPSVQNFKKLIFETPLLRMQLQAAIDQVPERVHSIDFAGEYRPGILHKCTIDYLLQMLNLAIQAPPYFLPSDFVGIPFAYFLVDLANTQLGTAFFSRADVNQHLKIMFDEYGEMLRGEKSLKYFNKEEGGLLSEEIMALVNYDDYVCDQNHPTYGFRCWNDWFTRNLAPGARPVTGLEDPNVVVHAAQNYPLTTLQLPAKNIQAIDKFWLKQDCYSLYDMFQAEKMDIKHIVDQSFVGGCVYQGYLNPWCYHQWHTPVSGIIQKSYLLPGTYFLQNPILDVSEPSNFDHSQAFLSCVATRHVFIINTMNPLLGRVGLIEVGMGEVSTCIPTVKEGDTVEKGQSIGRFQLGGSSHVIVFDRRAKLEFSPTIHAREMVKGGQRSTRQPVNSLLARVLV